MPGYRERCSQIGAAGLLGCESANPSPDFISIMVQTVKALKERNFIDKNLPYSPCLGHLSQTKRKSCPVFVAFLGKCCPALVVYNRTSERKITFFWQKKTVSRIIPFINFLIFTVGNILKVRYKLFFCIFLEKS